MSAPHLLCRFLYWALQVGGLQFLQWSASQPQADPALVRDYQKLLASPEFRIDIAGDLALHRSEWWTITQAKLADWSEPVGQIWQSAPETLPLMMLGMALKKNGFMTGEWSDADYQRWVRRLLFPGLLLNAVIAAWIWIAGFDFINTVAAFMAWSVMPRLMVTIGYAALLVLCSKKLAGSTFLGRVAAAGQAAFTNYLGTSIVMTTIFYGYGMGLYGHVSRPGLWLFVVGAWALMLLWSKPWLELFRFGPLEWLWRSLARGKLQPMRH